MTIWSDSLDKIYTSEIAVTATLDLGSIGSSISVIVIDKTTGIELTDENNLLTIRPAAIMRMSTLEANSITRSMLDGGTLTINSKEWRINGHMLKPNPDGELKGEIMLMLIDEVP